MATNHRYRPGPGLAMLLAGLLTLAGCGSNLPTMTAVASSSTSPAPSESPRGSNVVVDATPSPPLDAFLDQLVETVTDRLRVRSLPEISDASLKYEPVLPLGTELHVVGGPVNASGYFWYEVVPTTFTLRDGIQRGWVAMAGKDGEAWIALPGQPIAGLETAMSAVARTRANPGDAIQAADSISAFGLDLYRRLLTNPELSDENVVLSPSSIALALGMARLGAKGQTGTEMDDLLHVGDQAELEAGLNALDQALTSREGSFVDDGGTSHELSLRIANTSFAQRGWAIEPDFLDSIAAAFGAGLNLVDYAADPAAARRVINTWVSQQTRQRIPELLAEPDVSAMTRLYLVNAIYLKANWLRAFPEEDTASRPFTRLDGSRVNVPTMRLTGDQEVPYLSEPGWRATELRYEGPDRTTPLAMVLIAPEDLETFESSLSAESLRAIGASLTVERTRLESAEPGGVDQPCGIFPYSVDLFMPRFSIETRAQLIPPLSELGMRLAKDPDRADFSGIHVPEFEADNVYISAVIHQANIDVDEVGTEAAAATAVGMDTAGCSGPAPARTEVFRIDRPFLFAIRDIETGAILFLGRVFDPSLGR